MKIFRESIITFDKNLKINLIILSLMCINVTAISEKNMSLMLIIEEIPKPTSQSFKDCYFEVEATQWNCFWDASKIWQLDLETLLREHPKDKKTCCAFHDACNCMNIFIKNNDFCKDNHDYNGYFDQIVDLYAKNQTCLSANVGRNSSTCGSATNLFVNNINYIFYFIISFLVIINSFHLNFM
jgi:hypothetical protein